MSNYLTITNYMTNLIKKRLKSDVKSYKKNHYGKKVQKEEEEDISRRKTLWKK